jgi:plasmid stabilization system protein ParE
VLDNPRLKGLRSWPVSGFEAHRIYYVETPDAIRVIRILHGMRDLPPILEDE